jgi:O-antigen ligase
MQPVLRKIQYILLICLVSSMPFSLGQIKLNSYLIVLLLVNSLLLLIFSKIEIKRSFSGILILFILVYFIHLLGLFRADNFHEAFFELQKKISIFLFPVLLSFSPRLTIKEARTIMLSFVVSCLLTVIFCLLIATYRYFLFADSSFFFYHGLSSIVEMHATYLSMYFCFSIAILLYIYFNNVRSFSLRNKFIYYFSLSILTLMILLLGTRTQLLVLVIGTIIYFSFRFHQSNSLFKSILAGIVIGFFILGAVFLFPTNKERFKEAFNYDIGSRWGEKQVRYLMWSSALELIKMHSITGVGTGDVQDELQEYYLDHEYISLTYLANTRYNAHNQFLETAIGLGIPGLLVLLAGFFASLGHALKQRKILYLIFILLFMISCMTESMLERQSGVVFFAFFNSFLYFNYLNKKEESLSVVA